jgi:hypothetical protein
MPETAADFLKSWRQVYIYEALTVDELDEFVAECIDDAEDIDISSDDLDEAAGGDLKGYIRAAIVKMSGPKDSGGPPCDRSASVLRS